MSTCAQSRQAVHGQLRGQLALASVEGVMIMLLMMLALCARPGSLEDTVEETVLRM